MKARKLVAGVVLAGMSLTAGAGAASAQSAGSKTGGTGGFQPLAPVKEFGPKNGTAQSEFMPLPSFNIVSGILTGAIDLGEALIGIVIQTAKDMIVTQVKESIVKTGPAQPTPAPSPPMDGGVPSGGVPPQSLNDFAPEKSKEGTPPAKEPAGETKPASDSTSQTQQQTQQDSSKSGKDGEPPADPPADDANSCKPTCQNLPQPDGDGGPSGPAVHVPLDRVEHPTEDGGPMGPAAHFGGDYVKHPTIDGDGPVGPETFMY